MFWTDSAYPPTAAQVSSAAAAGMKAWGGYVGGPWSVFIWSKNNFDVIRNAGLIPVFIHVGSDGNQAVQLAKGCGAQPGDIVCVDIEAGWDDTYSAQWAGIVKAAGFRTCLYGLPSECDAHGGSFDLEWAASYTYPTVPVATAKRAYQYWNSHTAFGLTVDQSVCVQAWLGSTEDTMNIDIARSIVFVRLSDAYGNPASQAQVDAYAQPMAVVGANPETSLTNLNTDIAKDPSSLQNRVAALEAHIAPDSTQEGALANRVTAIETKLANVKGAL